jgi:D-2-hydroxyacid dehydrogenase (NADP+)
MYREMGRIFSVWGQRAFATERQGAMKTNLLIIDSQGEEYRKALEPEFPDLVIRACKIEGEVGDFIEKAGILLTFNISDELIRRAAKLEWIQSLATGVDSILGLPSLPKGVLVTSTRGIHGPQMSELAMLLMLALTRRFPDMIRNQDKAVWNRWPGELLWQKTAGILGLGAVGKEIARKCKAFGMSVDGVNRSKKDVHGIDRFFGLDGLLSVAREVDYLIIVVALTPETRGMVGAEVLAAMKPTAFLLNLARGPVVDETALIQALQSGTIAGAALDVFNEEPLPQSHPFWKMKNVILTPHVGGTSTFYAGQVLPIFRENLRRYLRGEADRLINRVDH